MTRSQKTQSRYELDVIDSNTAHDLEDQAKAVIETIEGVADWIDDRTIELSGARKNVTRAPAAVALREAVKANAGEPAAKKAAALVKAADDRYWRMVLRHDQMIQQDAGAAMRQGAADFDDTMQLIRMGWYRGAMRFEPERGFKFPTMARRWGEVYESIHRDRGPVATSNKALGYHPSVNYVHLDAPMKFGDGNEEGRIIDDFADESSTVDDVDDRLRQERRIEWLRDQIENRLSPSQRSAIEAMYLAGGDVNDKDRYAHLIDVARAKGVSKHAMSSSHRTAILRLRELLAAQGWDELDGHVEEIATPADEWPLFAKRVDVAA